MPCAFSRAMFASLSVPTPANFPSCVSPSVEFMNPADWEDNWATDIDVPMAVPCGEGDGTVPECSKRPRALGLSVGEREKEA